MSTDTFAEFAYIVRELAWPVAVVCCAFILRGIWTHHG
jgi:hypothetical protein